MQAVRASAAEKRAGLINYPGIFPNWKAEHPNEGVASILRSRAAGSKRGGDDSAGIGGGYLGSGSDITIKDNADVTPTAENGARGIGGGRDGDGLTFHQRFQRVGFSGGAAGQASAVDAAARAKMSPSVAAPRSP